MNVAPKLFILSERLLGEETNFCRQEFNCKSNFIGRELKVSVISL